MSIAIITASTNDITAENAMLALARSGLESVLVTPENASMEVLQAMKGFVLLTDQVETLPMPLLVELAASGRPMIGVGPGAKLLTAAGLVPGLENNKPAITLQSRATESSLCLRLTSDYQRNAFTKHISAQMILKLAMSPAEQCFVMSPALLAEMDHQGLNLLLYCDLAGQVQAEHPIAAVSNKAGNLLAILVLPPDEIFSSMRDYIALGQFTEVLPLNYYPRGKV